MRPAAKIQRNAFRAKHVSGFLAAGFLCLVCTTAIKDTGKVHIKNDVRKVGNARIRRHPIPVSMELTHKLKKHSTVILLVLCSGYLAVLGSSMIQPECMNSILFFCITHDRSGREFIDCVFHHRHTHLHLLLVYHKPFQMQNEYCSHLL